MPLLLLATFLLQLQTPRASVVPETLRVEALESPLAVGTATPRLSWKLRALDPEARGQHSVAHQVQAAPDEGALAGGTADRWDSGRVEGRDMLATAWAGRPLASGERVAWRVRVWDEQGVASAWSEAATFGVGLLEQVDWVGAWIGWDAPLEALREAEALRDARWFWHAADDEDAAPAAARAFRASVVVPAGARFESVVLRLTADDEFDAWWDGVPLELAASARDDWRRVAELDVTERATAGEHVLALHATNTSPGPAGVLGELVATSADGATLRWDLATDARSAVAPVGDWRARAFDDSAWPVAVHLAPHGGGPWGRLVAGAPFLPPPRLLRRELTIAKPLARATLHATALGLHELSLDGARVGEDWFTPGWTDYATRVHANTYDVTALLEPGVHVLAAVLGDGWYAGHVGYGGRRHHYGERTRLRAQLHLEYGDGTSEVVATGGDWRAAVGGTESADLLAGEVHDARREPAGWRSPGFDDAAWAPVDVGAELDPRIEPYPMRPARVFAELAPVSVTEPEPGVHVFDVGQNLAGVARLRVRAGTPAGTRIRLRFAERLNPDGTLYTTNLRGARATDEYVCSGDGPEVWTPRLTFHGFQYVEVTGLPYAPDADTITALAVGSDTPRTGWLTTSDPVVNRLVSNAYWTQRANFLEVPTDCPQRDERLGWTGDAQVYARTAAWFCDVEAFFGKWLVDLRDAQREDGQFPMVAPLKVAEADGGPGWADAGTICPWETYAMYGDVRELERALPSMGRFLDFCVERCTPDLLPPERFHCFGDWLSIGADTPKTVIHQAYLARSARIAARAAEAAGDDLHAHLYERLHAKVAEAFREAFVDESGRVAGDTQCGHVLALASEVLTPEQAELAARHLVADVEARGDRLSTGFLGTKDLMLVLSAIGRTDVAYRLLHQDAFPSWGYSIRHGATSIWERWNGWTPEDGFADPGMNSFAHYSFGAVCGWMFETIGGLRPLEAGFARIELAPRPGGALTSARTRFESVRGTLETAWWYEGDELRVDLRVPPATTARFVPPGTVLSESDRRLAVAAGVTPVGDGTLDLEPGRYRFRLRPRE